MESGAAMPADSSSARRDTRARIVTAAIQLLNRGGRDAVTTRAAADAAGVQAPTIYRLFTDKNGLLDAIAEHGFATYLKEKKVRKPSHDPVQDLRTGWDLYIDFGLTNPAIHQLMYGDPRPGVKSAAAVNSYRILREHIRRIAIAGRLRVSEERAAHLVHASGCGIVLTLLSMPDEHRDLEVSTIAREAVIGAITTEAPVAANSGLAAMAVSLRALLPEAVSLSDGERTLMTEWLDRLANKP